MFKKYKLQYGGINKCSNGFIKDNILNDCIKYDFGDNGITEKRNEVAELSNIAAKKITSNIVNEVKPYTNLNADELNAYLCLTGNIHNTDGALLPSDSNDINEACDEIGLSEIDVPNGDNSNNKLCMSGNAGRNENGDILRYKGDSNNMNKSYVKKSKTSKFKNNEKSLVYNYCNSNLSQLSDISQTSEISELTKFKYVDPQIIACTSKTGIWNDKKGICELKKN